MTTYKTGNPLGSAAAKDLFDNAQNLDFALNDISKTIWQDRLVRNRKTWYGIQRDAQEAIASFGYITLDSFEDGATLTLPNQVLRWQENGEYYRWDGEYPVGGKVVVEGSAPDSSGGIGLGAWLSVGDATLRGNLLSEGDALGDAIVTVKQPFDGAVKRTQHDKNAEFVTVKDAGALGDGVTDDTDAFTLFETWVNNKIVDLHGLTYAVSSVPNGNKYTNGYFLSGGTTYAAWYQPARQWSEIFCIGDGALSKFGPTSKSSQSLIVMGTNAAKSASPDAQGGIVLGDGAHEFSPFIPYQTIAIGKGSLARTKPDSSSLSTTNGNRNIGIGAYTGLYTTTGYQNVFIGRNTGSGITTGYQNTLMGTGAVSGEAPVGLSGEVVNIKDMVTYRAVGIGYNAGKTAFNASDSVFIGARAAQALKSGTLNTIVGAGAGINLGTDTAMTGNLYKVTQSLTGGTYSQSGYTITINSPSAHGAAVGDTIILAFTTGLIATSYTTDIVYAQVVSVPSSTQLTISSPVSLAANGNVTVGSVIGTTAGSANGNNTLVGYAAGASLIKAGGATIIGYRAAESLTECNFGTFLGRYAGAVTFDGAANTLYNNNVTAIGNNALLTANNQVQLGNADTTVYYYQMAQRSDERDKADIQDTQLGINFIRKLRFVDYKWDMREDYVEIKEGESGEFEVVKSEKDGSKKRKRWHHGVIAQATKEVLDEIGVDSGIHQDHTKCDGADVQTVSYNELIAPIGRAVQEVDSEITELKSQLSKALERISSLESSAG